MRRKISTQKEELPFPGGIPQSQTPKKPKFRVLRPVWTENKAKLIERYLLYFVYITKHGTYIDGFAGPQKHDKPEMWAAKLVLESEPKWLRHFHLFDCDKEQINCLEALKREQPQKIVKGKTRYLNKKGKTTYRDINIYHGDFNRRVHELLDSGSIGQKEATFCLLDQRTFECQWSTVRALAEYKEGDENKVELFYFLPNSWQDRALAALKNEQILKDWWDREDWGELRSIGSQRRRDLFVSRFEEELGYTFVTPWPIYESPHGSRVMYYMIHATDHDQAPTQMARAYKNAVAPKETPEQLAIEFGIKEVPD